MAHDIAMEQLTSVQDDYDVPMGIASLRDSPSHLPQLIECLTQHEVLNVAGESLDPTEPFTSYGLDSIAAFTLTLDLADWLERDLPASLLWEYPTIAEMAEFLGEENEK